MKFVIFILFIICLSCAACGGGGRVDIQDQRPRLTQDGLSSAPLTSPDPNGTPISLVTPRSLSLSDFIVLWNRYPELRTQFALRIADLVQPSFDWVRFEVLLTNQDGLRPPLTDLDAWSAILNSLLHCVDSFGLEWWDLTLSAPRPIGLHALFSARLIAGASPFNEEIWGRILTILRRPRIRTLGTVVWFKFLEVLPLELSNASLWSGILSDDSVWSALSQELPEASQELNAARSRVLAQLQEHFRLSSSFSQVSNSDER